MRSNAAATGLVVVAVMCGARITGAQAITPSDMGYAELRGHGPRFIPDSTRRRIAGDSHIIGYYARLLEGRVRTTARWDTSIVLYWLAESGDARYVPVLTRYARNDAPIDQFTPAVYGLSRHSQSPEIRARLVSLAANGSKIQRIQVAGVLAQTNSEASRSILRELHGKNLDQPLHDLVTKLLQTPASRSPSPMLCPHSTRFRQSAEGDFRCVPDAP